MLRPAVSLLAALALGALAGCGDDEPDQRAAVRETVERFGRATADKDYQQICDELLARDLVQQVERIGLPCEAALRRGLGDVRRPRLEVRQVAVQGARALVAVSSRAEGQEPSEDAMELVREDDEWRIASLASPEEEEPGAGTTATTTTPTTTTPPRTTTTP